MMRKSLFTLALAGLFACAAAGTHAQQGSSSQGQNQPAPNASAPSSSNSSNSGQSSGQSGSLADAARKARAAKQDSQKQAKVFDNDNIPTTGGISAVGSESDEGGTAPSESSAASSASSYPDGKDEKGWRALFSNLKHKLEQDQQLADVAQRELGVDSVQYYNDPTKTLMQEITRSDINKKTAEIEQKKKQVEADKQEISDAQEALRRAGGDPGWAE